MLVSVTKSLRDSLFIRLLTYFVLGVLLLVSPNKVINLTIYILSIYLFVSSMLHFYASYKLKKKLNTIGIDLYIGIFQLLFSFIILFFSKGILSFFPIVIGIVFIINGVFQLIENIGFKLKFGIFYSILVLALGFVLLFNPFGTILTMTRFLGVWFIAMTISEIVIYFKLKK